MNQNLRAETPMNTLRFSIDARGLIYMGILLSVNQKDSNVFVGQQLYRLYLLDDYGAMNRVGFHCVPPNLQINLTIKSLFNSL